MVRVRVNGRLSQFSCLAYTAKKADVVVFVADEGALRGIPLLVRDTGNAMRVKEFDGVLQA